MLLNIKYSLKFYENFVLHISYCDFILVFKSEGPIGVLHCNVFYFATW